MMNNHSSVLRKLGFFLKILYKSIAVFLLVQQPASALQNQLKDHASPYLAMHGKDPVQWQEWGADVLEKARQANKLIFVSSGYFSCHWCHVMHRESYSSSEISALLNEYFIPVKIDRELRPALDDYLINFVQQTTGQAGWPLNVFLTPEGYPLIGLTYAPPESFRNLLLKVSTAWQQQPDKATRLARELVEHELQQRQPADVIDRNKLPELPGLMVSQGLAIADEFEGGFGNQNRFPMAPQLLIMLDYLRTHENSKLSEFLIVTLDQMKNLGLRDHVNGGFFRYTVDPGWSEPHFEKMLYTQALLVRVYLDAAEVLKRPDYLDVVQDTLSFVIRSMKADGGGFVSSFSAVDALGQEGSGYLWSRAELIQLLTKQELEVTSLYWNLSSAPRFEMGNLPMITRSIEQVSVDTGKTATEVVALLKSARNKMQSRNKMALMPVDDKVLTAWNALMLSALSQAAMQMNDREYRKQAKQLRDFLIGHAWDGVSLSRAKNAERAIGRAGLEDYAYLARAISDYSVLTGSEEDWHMANLFTAKAWLYFYHVTGWKTGNENLLPGMTGETALNDGALPAADALLMAVSFASDNPAIRQKASDAAEKMLTDVAKSPFGYASHLLWLRYFLTVSD